MPRLVVPPAAQADLIEISGFTSLDNAERAAPLVAEIHAQMIKMAELPGDPQIT